VGKNKQTNQNHMSAGSKKDGAYWILFAVSQFNMDFKETVLGT